LATFDRQRLFDSRRPGERQCQRHPWIFASSVVERDVGLTVNVWQPALIGKAGASGYWSKWVAHCC
jgi:hypothetical protein